MKNKMLYLAKLQLRSELADGSELPSDECQFDFCISSNDKDTHHSIMTEKTLRNYQEDAAAGVNFNLDHSSDVQKLIGRTIAATYDEDNKRTNATVSMLRDTDDTPEHMRLNEYIRRIERGYYDSVSVEFRDAKETCNISGCGKDIFDWQGDDPCPHIPGRSYNGEVCTYNIDNARLRGLALVSAGSNPNAKLLDTREWDEGLRKVKQEGDITDKTPADIKEKTLLERDGLKYREQVIEASIKSGIRALDDFDEDVWRKRFEDMEAELIKEQAVTWDQLGNLRWGEGGRVTSDGKHIQNSDGSMLVLPSYLFEV